MPHAVRNVTLRIATAAAFPHDRVAAHARLLESVELDVVLLMYLDEAATPRLAAERAHDAGAGYVPEIAAGVRALAPRMFLEPGLRVITDAGGLNPLACAATAARVLVDGGSGEVLIGVARGDDLLDALEELHRRGCSLEHAQTGTPFGELHRPILAAHAELGGRGVHQALTAGARIVITGTVAATSLVVAAATSGFGWAWDEWDRLAGAAAAGALLRLGTRLTAGAASGSALKLIHPSPPILELEPQGRAAVSKVPTGQGEVTRAAIAAAIAGVTTDPAPFATPDVDVDLASVQLTERPDRQDVVLSGPGGRPPAGSYPVAIWFHDGFTARADLWLCGRDCVQTARWVAETIFDRLRGSGDEIAQTSWQLPALPDESAESSDAPAALLRITAADRRRERIQQFAIEAAAMAWTFPGTVELIGSGPPAVEPLVRRWPTFVPREVIEPVVEVRPAEEWL